MKNDLLRELQTTRKKERRLLSPAVRQNPVKQAIYQKVPPKVRTLLETAFEKAFRLVFLKGTQVIEKTFDKEAAGLEYEAGNFVVDRAGSRKSIRLLDKKARKDNLLNNAAATVSGLGLGLLGLGLPDIPLLVSTLLKGIYEIALGYGFDYTARKEQIYILRLICTALADGGVKEDCNRRLDALAGGGAAEGAYSALVCADTSLDQEIAAASKILSDALLVEKFVQGLPVVGVVGGFVNMAVYTRVSALAGAKYKIRYLERKLGQISET